MSKVKSKLSGVVATAPLTRRPLAAPLAIMSKSSKTPCGCRVECKRAATKKGRPQRSAHSMSFGVGDAGPLVNMKLPNCLDFIASKNASISSWCAIRDGIGRPSNALWEVLVVVAKPIAPACSASSSILRISAISSVVAARSEASLPIT